MPRLALDPAYRRVSVEEFLRMDFGDAKAELVDGQIQMMAGGRRRHNQLQANVMVALGTRLRGSSCQPFGPDQAVRTGAADIRYPDVSVYCGNLDDPSGDNATLLGDPVVLVEILSESTKDYDQNIKLPEYRALEGIQAVMLVDPETERVRLVTRTGPQRWTDEWLENGADVPLDGIGILLPASDIFARA